MLDRICIILGLAFCSPDPVAVAEEMMFSRCFDRLAQGMLADGSSLAIMPEEYTRAWGNFTLPPSWKEQAFGFELIQNERETDEGRRRECIVDLSPDAKAQIDNWGNALQTAFSHWANSQIASGYFVELPTCSEDGIEYTRAIETTSANAGNLYSVAAILIDTEADLFMFIAGETIEPRGPCE